MEVYALLSSLLKDFRDEKQLVRVPPIEGINFTFKKRHSNLLADYRIFVGGPDNQLWQHRQALTDRLLSASKNWTVPIVRCELDSSASYIQIFLARATAYQRLFRFILKETSAPKPSKANALVFVPFLDKSFGAVRTMRLALYASSCYLDQGREVFVYFDNQASVPQQAFCTVKVMACHQECDRSSVNLVQAAERLGHYNKEDSAFSLKTYLAARESSNVPSLHYDAAVADISVGPSSLANAELLVHLIRDHFKELPNLVLFVVPNSKSLVMQQSALLCEMALLSERSHSVPMMLFLTHEGSAELDDCSFDAYKKKREEFVREVFRRPHTENPPKRHKGEEEPDDTPEERESAVAVLVETELALEFLSSKQNVRMRLQGRLEHSDGGRYFSQYSSARIAALLGKFEAEVEHGKNLLFL